MDEQQLKASLDAYKLQASQVEAALNISEESNPDLSQLLHDLQELINLTEESLLSLQKSKLLAIVEQHKTTSGHHDHCQSGPVEAAQSGSSMDAEFAAFQATISNIDQADINKSDAESTHGNTSHGTNFSRRDIPPSDSTQHTEHSSQPLCNNHTDDSNIVADNISFEEIIGTKCRAPIHHEWGTFQYHNSMIVGVENIDEDSQPMVRVLSCNPTHRSLIPCPYYLDSKCKFTDEDCRYSHGHRVRVEDLQEFEDPDYSKLRLDADCLAKDSDGVWYKAKVIEANEINTFGVMFESNNTTATLDIEDIIPADYGDASEVETAEHETDSDLSDDELPVYLWQPGMDGSGMGEWEVHTRGIGSKLMCKMGYIVGQGLGKNNEGRAEPVPIQLLPSGKSLDKIMELKALAGDQNLYDVMNRQARKQGKVNQQSAKRYNKVPTDRTSVFDFINKKLGKKKGNVQDLMKNKHQKNTQSSRHISESDLKNKSDRQINVQMLRTHEEIRNVEKEVVRLKAGLSRNEGRDHTIASQLEKKINSMEAYLQQLKSSEKSLQGHRQSRSDHKKLTIF